MASEITDDFRKAMSNWVTLKKQLAEARADLKILNGEEKKLKEYIKVYMKTEEINVVNLKQGKVTMRTSKKTPSLSRNAVEQGLMMYFQHDEVRVEAAMTCIYDLLAEDSRETEVISLTGLNKKSAS
jgi:hypothetical protein